MKISGSGNAGSVAACATIHAFTPVTSSPPSEAKACVEPSTISFRRLSGKSSASQVIAATNSTHTPMNVVQRKKMNAPKVVENAAANGDSA